MLLGTEVLSDDVDSLLVEKDATYFVVETSHRIYKNFKQVDTVGLEEAFFIGEDEYQASIILFNPHLAITTEGKILQMSDTLYNPAIRVKVIYEDSVLQESWGFYYADAPHFYRDELLGFRLVDFSVSDQYIAVPKKK